MTIYFQSCYLKCTPQPCMAIEVVGEGYGGGEKGVRQGSEGVRNVMDMLVETVALGTDQEKLLLKGAKSAGMKI